MIIISVNKPAARYVSRMHNFLIYRYYISENSLIPHLFHIEIYLIFMYIASTRRGGQHFCFVRTNRYPNSAILSAGSLTNSRTQKARREVNHIYLF